MTADELLAWVGRLALDIEQGRRPPELTETVREVLDELGHAVRLPVLDMSRREILARVTARLEALD